MTSAVPIVPFVLRPADVSTREAEALLDSAVVVRSDDLVAEVVGPGAVCIIQDGQLKTVQTIDPPDSADVQSEPTESQKH